MSSLDPCFASPPKASHRVATGLAALAALHANGASSTPSHRMSSCVELTISRGGNGKLLTLDIARSLASTAASPADTKPAQTPAKPPARAKPAAQAKPPPATAKPPAPQALGSEPPSMSEPELASCRVDQVVSTTQAKLTDVAAQIGLTSAVFCRVRGDYYEQELAWRRDVLGASSVRQLCKSMIMENTKLADKSLDECRAEGKIKFVCVVVQYEGAKVCGPSPATRDMQRRLCDG